MHRWTTSPPPLTQLIKVKNESTWTSNLCKSFWSVTNYLKSKKIWHQPGMGRPTKSYSQWNSSCLQRSCRYCWQWFKVAKVNRGWAHTLCRKLYSDFSRCISYTRLVFTVTFQLSKIGRSSMALLSRSLLLDSIDSDYIKNICICNIGPSTTSISGFPYILPANPFHLKLDPRFLGSDVWWEGPPLPSTRSSRISNAGPVSVVGFSKKRIRMRRVRKILMILVVPNQPFFLFFSNIIWSPDIDGEYHP